MSKEKQIEEMARDICKLPRTCDECEVGGINGYICQAKKYAERAYNAGYRKQSEGEWIEKKRFYASGKTLVHYQCSLCGVYLATKANFCPNCGAKMKGGAE